jgi:hypothetical protein
VSCTDRVVGRRPGCATDTQTDIDDINADVAAIKAVTDNLPNSGALTDISDVTDALPDAGALTGISDETDKIDGATTDGLTGTNNSLAYRVHEIERHFHSYERWVEQAAVPVGETHVADVIGTGNGAFRCDAGNDDWGVWMHILGSSDTPIIAGSAKFDPHRITVEATERDATYFIQFAFGTSGAAALAAGAYTETVIASAGNKAEPGPTMVQSRRIAAGTKAWARTMCPGQNTAWIDFYLGIHEYEG